MFPLRSLVEFHLLIIYSRSQIAHYRQSYSTLCDYSIFFGGCDGIDSEKFKAMLVKVSQIPKELRED